MNREEFEHLFSALYFAISAHAKASGLTFRSAKSFPSEGYGTIEFGDNLVLTVNTADLEAFREASNLECQALIDGLVAQTRGSIAS